MKTRSPTSAVSSQFRGTSLEPTWIGHPVQLHLNHLSIHSCCTFPVEYLMFKISFWKFRVKVAVRTSRAELTTSVLT